MTTDKKFSIVSRIVLLFFFVVGMIAATATLASAQNCEGNNGSPTAGQVAFKGNSQGGKHAKIVRFKSRPSAVRLAVIEQYGESLWALIEDNRTRLWNQQGRARESSVGYSMID